MAYLYKLDFYVILLINTKGRENAKVFFVLFTKFQTLCSVEQFDIETTDGFFCLKFSCWLCVFIKNAFIFLCIICIYINVLCVFSCLIVIRYLGSSDGVTKCYQTRQNPP